VTEYTLLFGGKVWELCATELVDSSVFIDGALSRIFSLLSPCSVSYLIRWKNLKELTSLM